MAIIGKNNIIEMARSHKAPFWRIYESEKKRQDGNFVASADFDTENLGMESSMDYLRTSLDRLSSGRYIFVAYTQANSRKGGIDSWIEVDGNGGASINGIGNKSGGLYVSGFGEVNNENVEDLIAKKFEELQKKLKDEQERNNLVEENKRLKQELLENEGGFKKGLISVGSIAYGLMSGTPAGKEVIGMVRDAIKGMNAANPQSAVGKVNDAEVSGEDDERVVKAIEKLSNGNPNIVRQLEKLAELKEKDPATFEVAVSSLETM